VANETECELCGDPGGDLLWEDALCRVVRVTDPTTTAFPGFCRVIWQRHVAEMSDLSPSDAHHALDVLLATERAVRHTVSPDKINLASLGNVVPHLHWHVIPRWHDDSHFPSPIWAVAQRADSVRPAADRAMLRKALETELSTLNETP
jgi:diadenosine tetraphosphate (Ap4A) HIT family hydrolase